MLKARQRGGQMRFAILSHAGMLVETEEIKLVVDPWIVGSCYWRSWWNYPRPVLPASLDDITHIYLTHHHWDHFHGPSLRKLPKSAVALIPQAHSRRLVDNLREFGFRDMVELPHGKTVSIRSSLRITSYHFAPVLDSTLVVDDGTSVLVDMNDCKLTGLPLRQLMTRHPKVDFLFRSHSSADAYPHCVEAEDRREQHYRTNTDYLVEFAKTVELIHPRYAIPFASNQCFLHRDTWKYNETVMSPLAVKEHFEAERIGGSECVVMVAGDSWDRVSGFALQDHDHFTQRQRQLEEYAAEVSPILSDYYAREERRTLSFDAFKAYFSEFMDALPRLLRLVFSPSIVFKITTAGDKAQDRRWVLDFSRNRISESPALPPNWQIVITTPTSVLRDCVRKRMFSVWAPSKRLQIRVRTGQMQNLFLFMVLLDLYEYDYFPLRRMVSRRFLSTWSRRWREVVFYFVLLLRLARAYGRRDAVSVLVPHTE